MIAQDSLQVRTAAQRELIDLTEAVRTVVRKSGIRAGLCHVYVTGATAALIVNENDDPQLLEDFQDALDRLIPEGRWRHDRIDDNGAAHIKSAWVGPSETLPVRNGDLALGRWQNLFLCEFDGPRAQRTVHVTVQGE
jgi:secondary thiamine-phosphate synthase enzyme